MKKFLSLLLTFFLVFALLGCGKCEHAEYKDGKCTECGEEHTPHAWSEWVVVKEATEEEEGSKERTCECGAKETSKIAKLDHVHTFGEWVILEEATEEAAGKKERTCECGAKETVDIEKLQHMHNYVDGVCSCGDVAADHTHKYGKWTVVKEATEEEEGLKERVCACGDKQTEAIAKIDTSIKWAHEGRVTPLKEGFNSLDNQNANGAIDAEGYYEIAGQKIKTKNVYKSFYQSEIGNEKLNYLKNTWTYNSEVYTNMVDGLVENDKYSNIVGAIAKGFRSVENADGTQTWTFQLKEGVAWVDNATGEIYGEVTADDFVAGIKYVIDPFNASGTVGIVTGLIKGSAEYYDAMLEDLDKEELTDEQKEELWNTVGVKALDKYTLEYTLYQPTPYFLSSLTYSPFLPVSEKYLNEVAGSDFGGTVNDILVNGAFRVTEHIFQSKIVYTKNDKYYDAEHVYVDTVELKFYESTNGPTTTREWFEAGYIDSFSVNQADDPEGMKKYVYGENNEGSMQNPVSELCNPVLSVGDATYIGYYNFDRETYEYNNNDYIKTEAEKAASDKALLNANFRKGVLYGLNVVEYLKRYNPTDPTQWLMRGYTNRELTAYDGLDYADYVDAVFNEKQGTTGVSLTGIKNGSDPVYNPTKASEFFAAAKAELIAAGLTEADFPIKLDVIGSMNAIVRAYEEAMYKCLVDASNGVVKVQINIAADETQDQEWGSITNNYDFSMWSGWGPDYADPQTFLSTYRIGGDMVEYCGFGKGTAENEALEKEVLGGYDALYQKAAAIIDGAKTKERYQAFAEAEYALIYEYALIIPWLTQSGYSASVSKTIPYQAGRASYGLTSDKFKNVVVSETTITQEIRNAIVADYEANK